MKKYFKITFILSFLLFQFFQLVAQDSDLVLQTEIEKVTIHLQGAEIIRTAEVILSKENQRVVFKGLSPKLDPKSVQVTASNGVNILSISSKINFLAEQNGKSISQMLQDSIDALERQSLLLEDEKKAILKMQELLTRNQNLKTDGTVLSLEELEKAATYYLNKFKVSNERLSEIGWSQKEITAKKIKLQKQFVESNGKNQKTSEIYVSLDNDVGNSTKLRLRYVVKDAGWSPIYDLQARDLDDRIQLRYRALAFNDTGIGWKNVTVRLSTADPYQGAGQPQMNKWVLNDKAFKNQIYNYDKEEGGIGRVNIRGSRTNSQNYVIQNNQITSEQMKIQFETIEISELSSDFDIDEPYSIPSDKKPYSIEIGEYELPATYKHYAVPKMEKDAFLLAQITGWEDLDLISGRMNVYQGENFVGLANLNAASLNDTLELSLGRDKKVLVERLKLKDFSKKQFLGGNELSTLRFEISVKNNHQSPINIEVLDQIPISNKKEITVDLKTSTGARLFAETGKLQWKFNLNAGGKKDMLFEYLVKHPRGVEVKMRKMRQVVTPRYF